MVKYSIKEELSKYFSKELTELRLELTEWEDKHGITKEALNIASATPVKLIYMTTADGAPVLMKESEEEFSNVEKAACEAALNLLIGIVNTEIIK